MVEKTVLITGCSDGSLGAALALAFHKSGWRVFATARNPTKMSSLKAAGIETLMLDVVSEESLLTAVANVTKLTGGSLDALVNNAGMGLSMPVADLSVEEGKKMFDLNVWSVVSTTQAFLPLLLKSTVGGLIVNNTSIVGVMSVPFQGAYNASKAAAISLTQVMKLELAPFGIKVVDLRTGAVRSGFYASIGANDMSTRLPEKSMYQVARDPVEKVLSGVIDGKHVSETGQDASTWAKQVVTELNKKSPPAVVWRGGNAWVAWLVTLLPSKFSESSLKRIAAVDKVEEALKKQKQGKRS